MGGPNTVRGVHVQTLVALLKAFDNHEWDRIIIEPKPDEEGQDMIDIILKHQGSVISLLQVKSADREDAYPKAEALRIINKIAGSPKNNGITSDDVTLYLVSNHFEPEINELTNVVTLPLNLEVLEKAMCSLLQEALEKFDNGSLRIRPANADQLTFAVHSLYSYFSKSSFYINRSEGFTRKTFEKELKDILYKFFPTSMEAREIEEAVNFKKYFGFTCNSYKRRAIWKFYLRYELDGLHPNDIRHANPYLEVDENFRLVSKSILGAHVELSMSMIILLTGVLLVFGPLTAESRDPIYGLIILLGAVLSGASFAFGINPWIAKWKVKSFLKKRESLV